MRDHTTIPTFNFLLLCGRIAYLLISISHDKAGCFMLRIHYQYNRANDLDGETYAQVGIPP